MMMETTVMKRPMTNVQYKNKRKKEIADGNEECQSDNDTGMMPYTPGLYSLRQTVKDCPSIESIAARSDKAKDGCRHALIALIGTESEWLQQIEYRPYDYTI